MSGWRYGIGSSSLTTASSSVLSAGSAFLSAARYSRSLASSIAIVSFWFSTCGRFTAKNEPLSFRAVANSDFGSRTSPTPRSRPTNVNFLICPASASRLNSVTFTVFRVSRASSTTRTITIMTMTNQPPGMSVLANRFGADGGVGVVGVGVGVGVGGRSVGGGIRGPSEIARAGADGASARSILGRRVSNNEPTRKKPQVGRAAPRRADRNVPRRPRLNPYLHGSAGQRSGRNP